MAELRYLFKRAIRVERAIWLLRYGRLMAWLWKRFMKVGAWCHRESWRVCRLLDGYGYVGKAKREETE